MTRPTPLALFEVDNWRRAATESWRVTGDGRTLHVRLHLPSRLWKAEVLDRDGRVDCGRMTYREDREDAERWADLQCSGNCL